jgi:hypothetical protein
VAAAYEIELPDLAAAFRASNGQEQPDEDYQWYPPVFPYRDRTLD